MVSRCFGFLSVGLNLFNLVLYIFFVVWDCVRLFWVALGWVAQVVLGCLFCFSLFLLFMSFD